MYSMSPTFILGIWHEGDWLKRDLDKPIYGQGERDSPITSWFIALMNEKFIPSIFICKCVCVYLYIYIYIYIYIDMDFDG